MKSFLYLTLIIIILVILVLLSCSKYKVKSSNLNPTVSLKQNNVENFVCPKSKYHLKQKINYKDDDSGIVYGEDEDINYKIDVPLVKRREPFFRGWRNFNREKFMIGEVPKDDNFEGTPIRNYLDNLIFFHN